MEFGLKMQEQGHETGKWAGLEEGGRQGYALFSEWLLPFLSLSL